MKYGRDDLLLYESEINQQLGTSTQQLVLITNHYI